MEPAKSTLIKIAAYRSRIVAIKEQTYKCHVSGSGKDWVYEEQSLGWYIVTEENVSFYVGKNEPTNLAEGDMIIVTLSKEQNNGN